MKAIPVHELPLPGRRVVVVGVTGSGKTTLAARIAAALDVPHVELDALRWEANWTPAETSVFRERITIALAGDAWVVDGNYSEARDLVWSRADTLVWLDYPLALSLWRLWWRSIRRVVNREVLWNNNRESFRGLFLSTDSLFLWAFKSRPKHRRQYPHLLQQPEYSHLCAIRLVSARQTDAWLERIKVPLGRLSN